MSAKSENARESAASGSRRHIFTPDTYVWITLEPLLNLKREPLHAAPHIRVACRDPDPDAARNRDHRRPRNVAAIKSALADALMLTRTPPGISTTIAGAN